MKDIANDEGLATATPLIDKVIRRVGCTRFEASYSVDELRSHDIFEH